MATVLLDRMDSEVAELFNECGKLKQAAPSLPREQSQDRIDLFKSLGMNWQASAIEVDARLASIKALGLTEVLLRDAAKMLTGLDYGEPVRPATAPGEYIMPDFLRSRPYTDEERKANAARRHHYMTVTIATFTAVDPDNYVEHRNRWHITRKGAETLVLTTLPSLRTKMPYGVALRVQELASVFDHFMVLAPESAVTPSTKIIDPVVLGVVGNSDRADARYFFVAKW